MDLKDWLALARESFSSMSDEDFARLEDKVNQENKAKGYVEMHTNRESMINFVDELIALKS